MTFVINILREHPIAAMAIGIFLVLQCFSFIWLLLGIRRWRKEFTSTLNIPLAKALKTLRGKHPSWASWCISAHSSQLQQSWSSLREEFFNQFDMWLSSRRSYLFLQRTSIMAPLLGVIITAAGFLSLSPSMTNEDTQDVLAAIIPLVVGVGGGAMLAFVNQLLLQMIDTGIDSLRVAARTWYDTNSVLDPIQIRSESENQVIVAQALSEAANQNEKLLALLEAEATRQEQREKRFEQTMNKWVDSVEKSPDKITVLNDAIDLTAKNLTNLAPLATGFISSFDKAVNSFQEAVEHELKPILSQFAGNANDMSEIVFTVRSFMKNLDEGSALLKQVAERQDQATTEYLETLKEGIIPQQQALIDTAKRVETVSASLATPVENFLETMQGFVAGFSDGMKGLEQISTTAEAFSRGIQDQFLPSAELHRKVLTNIQISSQGAQDVISNLDKATSQLVNSSESNQLASQSLQDSIDKSAVPANTLLERTVKKLEESTETLSEHADRYRAALQSHADGVSNLEQHVTHAIASISKVAEVLETASGKALKEPIEKTNSMLGKMESVSSNLEVSVNSLKASSDDNKLNSELQLEASRNLVDSTSQVKDTAAHINEMLGDLRSITSEQLQPSQTGLHEAVIKLQGSTEQLSQFMQTGIAPLTDKIQAMNGTLADLHSVVESISAIAAGSKDATRFLDAMDNAAEYAEAIRELPRQLREELLLASKHQVQEEDSSSKNGGWLSGIFKDR